MSRSLRFAAAVMALALLPAMGVLAEPDETFELTAGDTQEFSPHGVVGANVNYFGLVGEPGGPTGTCTKDPNTFCDTFLVKLSNPLTQEEIDAGKLFNRRSLTVTVNNFYSDLDLVVFASDETGERGTELGRSGEPTFEETVTTTIRTDEDEPEQWVVIDVIYFAGTGVYDGLIQF